MDSKTLILILLGCFTRVTLTVAQGHDTIHKNDTSKTPNSSTITTSGNVNTGVSTNTGVLPADTSISVFVLQAVSGSEKEIQIAKVAKNKTQNKNIKSFASKMINDHTKANIQLKKIANKKKIPIPFTNTETEEINSVMLANKQGVEFDKAYIDMMISDHESTVGLYEKAAESLNDPEMKAFIDKTLPILKQHYEMARIISNKLQGKSSGANPR